MKTFCRECGDTVPARRAALGYGLCLCCGEKAAKTARMGWCVVQEYGKGGYKYVTADAARTVLRETNQKNPR